MTNDSKPTTKMNPMLASHLKKNRILVTAIPQIGPHASAEIVVIENRKDFVDLIKQIQSLDSESINHVGNSILNLIREELMNALPPDQNKELMNDLSLFCAFQMVYFAPEAVGLAGLFNLALRINPDESLPWQKRGMLDPKLLQSLNVSDVPVNIY